MKRLLALIFVLSLGMIAYVCIPIAEASSTLNSHTFKKSTITAVNADTLIEGDDTRLKLRLKNVGSQDVFISTDNQPNSSNCLIVLSPGEEIELDELYNFDLFAKSFNFQASPVNILEIF